MHLSQSHFPFCLHMYLDVRVCVCTWIKCVSMYMDKVVCIYMDVLVCMHKHLLVCVYTQMCMCV